MTNHYDNLEINIAAKHADINSRLPRHSFGPLSLVKRLLHHFLFEIKIFGKLIDAGFIRRWFSEFNFYWQRELGGRPLKFHDFFFLYSWYRVKYQNIELKNESDPAQFLADWQHPANIYQIFSCAYQYSANPFSYLPFKKYLHRGDSILEYGAGFAPITTSLATYRPGRYRLTIADIPQHSYHYAKWKLLPLNVKTVDINPASLPPLAKYDAIFIITVLEHLTNPLVVIKHLTEHLNPSGFLIFDYIKSDAEGLDTQSSLNQRQAVLNFIKENYKIIEGNLNPDYTVKTCVVKK